MHFTYHLKCFLIGLIILFLYITDKLNAQEALQKLNDVFTPQAGLNSDISDLIYQLPLSSDKMKNSVTISTITLNTFLVTTVEDTGSGSIRDAIIRANNSAGLDIIEFNIPGTGVKTISPLSPLPDITDQVIIDGTTQTDYSGKPMIEIDGVLLSGSDVHGLYVNTSGCIIKGIAVNRFPGVGIYLVRAQNTIEGCFIGLHPGPVAIAKGNAYSGILVISADNKIGNPSGNRNVISGNNGSGVFIFGQSASGNVIQNSYLGTTYDGQFALPNKFSGIELLQVSNCIIGGTGAFNRNIISGNTETGINIRGGLSQNIIIKGNIIGTKADGNWPLANKQGIQIIHETGQYLGSPSNVLIGGMANVDQNLISGNSQAGIAFFLGNTGGSGNVVTGNFIGTNHNGTNKVPNNHGIYIQRSDTSGAMPGVRIGGVMLDSNNVISGNKEIGVFIYGKGARNNVVLGNYIGITSPTAAIFKLGNGLDGITIKDGSNNKIGDENPVRGNVISGNLTNGIFLKNADNNFISNNFIGTYLTDGFDIGNFYHGIYIEGSNTTIGGNGLSNKIAFNKKSGVYIFSGTGNRFHLNSIYQNAALGVDLGMPGVTSNDSADVDTGPNLLQNFPFLDSLNLGPNSIKISGRLYSKPNSPYTLHFYKNDKKNPLNFGEGQFYLDSLLVTTNDTGWATFNFIINQSVKEEQFITALTVDAYGNTSEFSYALCQKDKDGDGIYDIWETEGGGIDINQDGIIDLELFKRGARPNKKDIFVEIDHMEIFKPKDEALAMVIDAFKKVPNKYINNPNGEPGINLVIEHNDIPVPNELLGNNPWAKFHEIKKEYFGTQFERAHPNAKNLLEAKKLVYRYCLWANFYGTKGSSGNAENNDKGEGGNDFLITLGTFEKKNSDSVQAGTFMHELGHTLGLQHGGIDSINYKPNYISVMNYAWQTPQIKSQQENLFWRLDYSRQELPPLKEDLLEEAKGLGSLYSDYPDSIYVPYSNIGVADVMLALMYPNTPVDWDADGDVSGFASRPVDINDLNETTQPSPGETLLGHNDWEKLKYNFRNSSFFKEDNKGALKKETIEEFASEMTPEIYNYLQSLPPYGIVKPTLLPASIKWLGTLGGTESTPYDISDDGRVVVGVAEDSSYQAVAFRWTPETGMQSLGVLRVVDDSYWSEAYGVSGDGKVIVGMGMDSNYTKKAFRWTEEEGMIDLNIGSSAVAYDISGDGSAIVGYTNIDSIGGRGFRYRRAGLDLIGTIGGYYSSAMGVNYDGSMVVGYADNFSGDPYAILWSEDSEYNISLSVIGSRYSFANKIAGNGSVVTGFETGVAGRYRAFRWSLSKGLELNILGDFSEGFDVSDDGEFIVGYAAEGAFRFSRDNQVEYYDEILKDDLSPGTELYSLTAISSDGRFAVGVGYNPITDGDEAFLLDTGGRILITDIKDREQVGIASDYKLEQNYPNPFNPGTTIRYSVPVAAQVTITVFNILGQQVAKLVDEYKLAGRYEIRFDASRFASGVYLYNIQAGNFFETKKMMLVK